MELVEDYDTLLCMPRPNALRSGSTLLLFLALCFGAAFLGSQFEPGSWYAALDKPSWNPPPWVFAPVWTVLYLAMAIAAWLIWLRKGWRDGAAPLVVFFVQLALNAAWSWIFFGLHRMGWAFVEIVVLEGAILLTAWLFWKVRPLAAVLLLPYAAWVGYAAALNFTLWRMNAP